MENEVDRKDLKIQALLEKISNMTSQYENQVADLRVELTVTSQHLESANRRIIELESPDVTETQEDSPSN